MSSPAPRAVTPEMIISSSKKEKAAAAEQGAFRGRRSGKGKDGNNDSSSGGKPSKRRKTNNQQGIINEFDQEFGDVESLFLSGDSTRRRQQDSNKSLVLIFRKCAEVLIRSSFLIMPLEDCVFLKCCGSTTILSSMTVPSTSQIMKKKKRKSIFPRLFGGMFLTK